MHTFDPTPILYACRHGESHGNVARAEAEQRGWLAVETRYTDKDFPLTDTGRRQATRLGRMIAEMPPSQRPTRLVVSPFRRALETAEAVVREGYRGGPVAFSVDARLTPKSFGVIERLTRRGVAVRYPQLDAQRRQVGRFHFCPPGGESRCDVVLRVREFLAELCERNDGHRVLLVTHQAVINALSYLLRGGQADAFATGGDGHVENAQLQTFALTGALPATIDLADAERALAA
jgi:broad specificity phosphatase PhoE